MYDACHAHVRPDCNVSKAPTHRRKRKNEKSKKFVFASHWGILTLWLNCPLLTIILLAEVWCRTDDARYYSRRGGVLKVDHHILRYCGR